MNKNDKYPPPISVFDIIYSHRVGQAWSLPFNPGAYNLGLLVCHINHDI
jgi:hypothetical protein